MSGRLPQLGRDRVPEVLEEVDRRVLEFAGAHGRVGVDHVTGFCGLGAEEAGARLRELAGAGLLARERLGRKDPRSFRVTAAGLAQVERRLPAPGFGPRYGHARGVVWLWLAARDGTFGPVERVLSEREMRAEDLEGSSDGPFGVELPSSAGGRVHYPDLLLVLAAGRVPVVLQGRPPPRAQLRMVLRGYAADARVAAVLFLISDLRVGEIVQSVAAGLELSRLVHVQLAKPA